MTVPPSCEIAITSQADKAVCAISGELDLACIETLQRAVDDIDLGEHATLGLDLTNVTFADSSVLAWMLALQRQTEAAEIALTVTISAGPVARLLELTGVTELLCVIQQPASQTLTG